MTNITEPIKALSWKQPYGGLMFLPVPKIETRTWATKYRGLVLICSSKADYSDQHIAAISGDYQWHRMLEFIPEIPKKNNRFDAFANGAALGIGRIIDCYPMREQDEDRTFVKYNPGLYCHVYDEVKPIEQFAWKGSLGFRDLTQDEINKIVLL